ncbi:MAG: type II secretion system protein GspJ [Nitrospiria bacterium]
MTDCQKREKEIFIFRSQLATRNSQLSAGFTLLEILITMAILAVLATMVYASFSASIRMIERVDSEADIYRNARLILARLSEELSMAYRPKGKAIPEVIFVGENDVMDGRPQDSLRFTSLSHPRSTADEATSDLNLIEYRFEIDPEDRGWVLLHSERNNLYGLSRGGSGEFVIGEGIHSLNLRYFDGKTWVDGWDAESEKALPLVVEIEIRFHEPREGQRSFKSWVELPLAK